MKLIEKFPLNPYIIEWNNIFLDSLRRKRFHMFPHIVKEKEGGGGGGRRERKVGRAENRREGEIGKKETLARSHSDFEIRPFTRQRPLVLVQAETCAVMNEYRFGQ